MKTPEELHIEKLKEIGYKDKEIDRVVYDSWANAKYDFAQSYAEYYHKEKMKKPSQHH